MKLIEQRHADMLKEMTVQCAKDKEQLSFINQNLEDKIMNLESETVKLKNDLIVAQKYSLNLEKENQTLSYKIGDLEKDKGMLLNKVGLLETEKQRAR